MKTIINMLAVFAGIILGGYLGSLALAVPALKFLGYGAELGLTSPLVLDLNVLKLTFGFTVNLNIASILGLIVALFIIRKVIK